MFDQKHVLYERQLASAAAKDAEPAPALCHPTDPCAHGITGPCGKCQHPPRTRADVEADMAAIVRALSPEWLEQVKCINLARLVREWPTRHSPAPAPTLSAAERAVLEACAELTEARVWYLVQEDYGDLAEAIWAVRRAAERESKP